MAARGAPSWERNLIRKFPRIDFVAPVQIPCGSEVLSARSRNLSLGGMLLEAECNFPPGAELRVCFELAAGKPMNPRARVVHCRPGERLGVEFIGLEEYERTALREFIRVDEIHQRRGIRLPERLFVRLYWSAAGRVLDVPAETILLSRHGCMLLSQTLPPPSAALTLWWPDKQAGTDAKIVWRRDEPNGWITAALEFGRDSNFWGINFEADA